MLDSKFFVNHIHSLISYWKDAVDWENGGIYFQRRFDNRINTLPRKNLLMHVRQLYNFSIGIQYGIEGSEKIADHLYDSLDKVFGKQDGIYHSSNQVFDFSSQYLHAYDQCYVVIALSKYASIKRSQEAYLRAKSHYELLMSFFSAGSFKQSGIYARYALEDGLLIQKSGNTLLHHFEACLNLLDAAQSILRGEALSKEEHWLRSRLHDSYFLFFKAMFNKEKLFIWEELTEDMSPPEDAPYHKAINGHALEWIGFLWEAENLLQEDLGFLSGFGKALTDKTLDRSLKPNGAFCSDYFVFEDKVMPLTTFWSQIESVLALLYAFKSFKEEQYLGKAVLTLSFYEKYYMDFDSGVFTSVSSDGIIYDRRKGDSYKCDHHSIRVCEKILQYHMLPVLAES